MPILVFTFGMFALAIGCVILWADPRRRLNQILFFAALIQFLWVICVSAAMHAGERGDVNAVALWLKLNAGISAFFPLGIWSTKELVVGPSNNRRFCIRALPWLGVGLVMCALTFQNSFLTQGEHTAHFDRSTAYFVYQLIAFPLYIVLVVDICRCKKSLTGVKRIEIQFFSLNLAIAALIAATLTVFGNAIDSVFIKRSSVAVVFSLYVLTAWAIMTYRIFDVNRVLTSITHKVGIISFLSITISLGVSTLDNFIHPTLASIASVISSTSVVFWFERHLKTWLDLDGRKHLALVRNDFINASLNETDPDRLAATFIKLLKHECFTDFIELRFLPYYHADTNPNSIFRLEKTGFDALCRLGWATPESLEYLGPQSDLAGLHNLLIEAKLGAIVVSPAGTNEPSLVVALGHKNHMWPYTHFEIQKIHNIAGLIDSTLARCRLATQAAAQTKVDNLEIMSRGFAHDLRNLLTPLSTFLIHTEDQFPHGTAGAEVHLAAKQSVHAMTAYIRETLFFSKQLTPDISVIDLNHLLQVTKGLTISQAKSRGISVVIETENTGPIKGDFVLLQRLLINLVNNATDASATGQTIRISAQTTLTSTTLLKVTDTGTGISPENMAKIFNPYFTTKDKGEELRGIGLGLAICKKIADLHGGTILVETTVGKGSTFIVELPLAPSTCTQASPPDLKPRQS